MHIFLWKVGKKNEVDVIHWETACQFIVKSKDFIYIGIGESRDSDNRAVHGSSGVSC